MSHRAGRVVLDSAAIQRYLPHRYPLLLVDRIVELEPKRIVGIKNVTINEPFFQGHFPGYPIMPGVLIIEALAQVGAVLAFSKEEGKRDNKMVFFLGIDGAKFRKPVVPGDQLRLEVSVLQVRSQFWRLQAMAYVEDTLVCEAELKAMIADRESGGQS